MSKPLFPLVLGLAATLAACVHPPLAQDAPSVAKPLASVPKSPRSYALQQAPARLPVLVVLPQSNFIHMEMSDPRSALQAAGWPVVVASEQVGTCQPFIGDGFTGVPEQATARIVDQRAQDFAAIVVPGGFGASRLAQSPLNYADASIRRVPALANAVEGLLRDFQAQGKPILGVCHGVSVLAWARVPGPNGQALPFLNGRSLTASDNWGPLVQGQNWRKSRDEVREALGPSSSANLVAPYLIGLPDTSADDVVEDGLILTAQDNFSAAEGGRRLASRLNALEAERLAAEEAARLEAERLAAEEAARLEAERLAAEEAARLAAEAAAQARAQARRVLVVGANEGVWWPDHQELVAGLQAAGLSYEVAAGQAGPCTVEGGPPGASIQASLSLAEAQPERYGAILFLGGWGLTALQPSHPGLYSDPLYRGQASVKAEVQRLVQAFHAQNKLLVGLCHGGTVLAWSRVPNAQGQLVSPLAGRQATCWPGPAPNDSRGANTTARHLRENGATVLAPGSVGDPTTAADDVVVDGRVITAQQDVAARALAARLALELPQP